MWYIIATTLAISGIHPTVSAPQSEESPYWLDERFACGPLCLAFIDRLLGGDSSYKEIARSFALGPHGTNLQELQKNAAQLGYGTIVFRADTQGLANVLRTPAIIHVKADGFGGRNDAGEGGHFIVLAPVRSGHADAMLYDPPDSLREISLDELDGQFTGYGLLVAKGGEVLPTVEAATNWGALIAGIGWMVLTATLLFGRVKGRRCGEKFRLAIPVRILVVGAIVLGFAGCSNRESGIGEQVYDAGTVPANETIKHVFRLRNITPDAITVKAFEGQCACERRVLGGHSHRVEPGEWIEAEVAVSAGGDTGPLQKKFILTTDSRQKELARIQLVLQARVQALVTLVPSSLQLGRVVPGHEVKRLIKVLRPNRSADIVLEAVTTNMDWLTARTLSSHNGETTIEVTCCPRPLAGQGLFGEVLFKFSGSKTSVIKVPVAGRLESDFRVVPSVINVKSEGIFKTIRVSSASGRAFKILEALSPTGISVDSAEIGMGARCHELHVLVVGGVDKSVTPFLTLTTDLKDHGTLVIPLAW